MDVVSLIGIAIGLSMDAFAVSITNGAVTRNVTVGFATKLAASFGHAHDRLDHWKSWGRPD